MKEQPEAVRQAIDDVSVVQREYAGYRVREALTGPVPSVERFVIPKQELERLQQKPKKQRKAKK